MSEFKAAAFTMLIVLLTIAVYNSLLKCYTPQPIRNIIGLG
jgi:hypothetical protein